MSALEDAIRAEIAHEGPMTFARFMALALYHPTLGYYAGGGSGREPLGWEGDYFTSGDLHPLWGWAIARQLYQMWELRDRGFPCYVLELGAGRGLLAAAVWRYAREHAPHWLAALQYVLVDRAPADSPLRAAREARLSAALADLGVPDGAVRWIPTIRDMFAPRILDGTIVSNELVDALPVHVLQVDDGALHEIYVASEQGGRLVERLGPPSTPELAAYLERFSVPWRTYPSGWRCEVSLEAIAWMREIGATLRRGFVLTIDYGDTARRLYTPDRRHGTLAVYARHQRGERPLDRPGRQDLTAHVNFTALVETGRESGLRLAGLTTQADFLRRLGIHEEAEALGRRLYPAADTERASDRGQADHLRRMTLQSAVAALLDPTGLGGFRVLIQQRGVPGAGRALLGLAAPAGGPPG